MAEVVVEVEAPHLLIPGADAEQVETQVLPTGMWVAGERVSDDGQGRRFRLPHVLRALVPGQMATLLTCIARPGVAARANGCRRFTTAHITEQERLHVRVLAASAADMSESPMSQTATLTIRLDAAGHVLAADID